MENTLEVANPELLADVGKAMLAIARTAVMERNQRVLSLHTIMLGMESKLALIQAKLCNNEDIQAELDGLSDLVAELGMLPD